MNEINFWNFILNTLNSDNRIVLLIVAESSDSSPGRQGFKMAVNEGSDVIGTIGGGIMENDMCKYANDLLSGNETRFIKRLHHTNKTKLEKSGLICGGYQTIIFSLLDKSCLPIIENIILSINKKQNGKLSIASGKIEFHQTEEKQQISFNYKSDEDWHYDEIIGLPFIAYIAGGGHVGLAISRVMKSLGFYVVVFDHRENVNTIKQNTFADEINIIKYEEIGDKIIEGERSYIIIVTPMHSGDKNTLKSVISKDVKYIGMMGSKRKIKTIFESLSEDGVDNELFKKIHTPIGIEIEAETPEEIAISIAAEIIKVKNTQ
jgi:xanthine dehydrogenase accessory factor